MIVILKPKGRGRWHSVVMTLEGSRASPLLICAGQLLTLGGVVFRVCRVLP